MYHMTLLLQVLHPRILGRGAYGEVLLATWIHSSKNERVAVKKGFPSFTFCLSLFSPIFPLNLKNPDVSEKTSM